jgi:methionyl-tRNA formyltransferase
MMAGDEKILFLGPPDAPLVKWLSGRGERVSCTARRLSADWIALRSFTFLVSYGYRYIISPQVLDLFPNRAINLHISLLPWNRGAHPNLWSFAEHTPKGVSIHYIDAGVDTGDLIVQKELHFDSSTETLASSWAKLNVAIEELFRQHWPEIRSGRCPRLPQRGNGTVHKTKDYERLQHLLTEGWETPVSVLEDWQPAFKTG